MQKTLITGGSSGIGYELAKLMAAKGHDLYLVARDAEQLQKAKKELISSSDIHVEVLVADLSEPGSAQRVFDELRDKGIEILVNNAGVGLKGDFFGDSLAKNQRMMQLNMTSLMELTHLFGGEFVARGHGKILNVASIAAFFPGPKQPVYYATKAFVRSFSRAIAYNLSDTGVTVTTLHPGVTKTNFFIASRASGVSGGASPSAVAQTGYRAMMRGDSEVTHGLRNKLVTQLLARLVPYRLQARIIDKASDV